MDAVQVEPVVPTIGLTAGRDADITTGIGVSASCIPLIWVATMNAPLKSVVITSGVNKHACVKPNKNLLFIILYGVRRNWKIM